MSNHNSSLCDVNEALDALSHAVSVAQHHDAVTGTEKQYVTEDYHYRLDRGVHAFLGCAHETTDMMIQIGQYNCPLLNISQCDMTENHKKFYVSVYNPLSRNRSTVIRLPILDYNLPIVYRMVSHITSYFNQNFKSNHKNYYFRFISIDKVLIILLILGE